MFFINKPRWLATIVGLGLVGIIIALPVLAEPPMQSPNDGDRLFVSFFTDEVPIEITDLSGTPVGEGVHIGVARCNVNNCSRKTQLDLNLSQPLTGIVPLEYHFTTRQALDFESRTAVVSGVGTIFSRGQKERFSFTAVLQDNNDGTVSVMYEASRPDASFLIPNAPGTFEIY